MQSDTENNATEETERRKKLETCPICFHRPLSLAGPISQRDGQGNDLYTCYCRKCTYNGYRRRDYSFPLGR
jgi:hypothetical protein